MTEPEVSGPHDPAAGVAPADGAPLAAALEGLRARLDALALVLDTPGADLARADRDAVRAQLDDYLLPRLRARSAPLLVVVGGSTGAGKSTLVNSLLGEQVSAPGVLRPTTRAPVLVHHPLDARWFTTDRVLPGLARVTTPPAHEGDRGASTVPGAERPTADDGGGRALRLAPAAALPRGLALLDAPDVDSVDAGNRRLAAQLLDAADLWLFVTTAARYADAVPWDLLHRAAERHAQVALVVDRVDPGAEEVVADLRRMMDEHGLPDAPLFAVPESATAGGLLPESAIGAVATWLTDLGADAAAREQVATSTRDGVVDDLVRRADALAAAADLQASADERLRAAVAGAYADAAAQVRAATSDGAMLRGEVLTRWQELVGTGDLLRSVEHGVGRVRDAVTGFLRGRPAPAPRVEHAIAHGLAAVVLDAADAAAARTHAAWRGDAAGVALLPDLDLSRASTTLREQVDAEVRGWQADVLDLVREQGAERRGTARYLSFGVNAAGVSLMVLAFASTGGLTGVEVGIAGGTAVVAQKLLEAVFGDDAVRRLTVLARERLDVRVVSLLGAEAERYTAQLDALGARDASGAPLRAAAREVVRAADDDRATRAGPTAAPAAGGGSLRGAGARGGTSPAGGGVPGTGRPGGRVHPDGGGADTARRPGRWRRLLGRRRVDPHGGTDDPHGVTDGPHRREDGTHPGEDDA